MNAHHLLPVGRGLLGVLDPPAAHAHPRRLAEEAVEGDTRPFASVEADRVQTVRCEDSAITSLQRCNCLPSNVVKEPQTPIRTIVRMITANRHDNLVHNKTNKPWRYPQRKRHRSNEHREKSHTVAYWPLSTCGLIPQGKPAWKPFRKNPL